MKTQKLTKEQQKHVDQISERANKAMDKINQDLHTSLEKWFNTRIETMNNVANDIRKATENTKTSKSAKTSEAKKA